MNKKLAIAAACSLAAVPLGAAPAAADPSSSPLSVPVTIDCDNGQVYDAVFVGGASWNALLDTDSNAILVPTEQQFNAVVTDAEGNVVFEVHDPAITKGSSAGRQPNTTFCSFDFTVPFDDGSTAHIYGTTTAFVTPGS